MNLSKVWCKHCGQETMTPFYVVKHFGYITRHLPFCSEHHANEYYIGKLRKEGM